jgi:predicted enzyme related to lactoylglutathione lyase
MTYKIEVLILPVSDVDRALAFYTEKAGFTLDARASPTSTIPTATGGCCRNAASATSPGGAGA